MILEQMENRLEYWKRFVWICLGASGAQLLAAALDLIFPLRHPDLYQYYSWLLTWILVQGSVISPAVVLTLHPEWRKVPMSLRFQSVFGSLAAAWTVLFSFGLRLRWGIDTPQEDVLVPVLILGLILMWMYLRLRKQLVTARESMFP